MKAAVFHLLTGEYPPHAGGVGDYTQLVAEALAERGCAVHVWSPAVAAARAAGPLQLHRLTDRFGAASRAALEAGLAAAPGCVLVQYVPNALGARGANLRFCLWLRRLGRRHDVRIMFHEPYFYFAWQHPLRNGLAAAQRLMAAVLLRAGPVAYASTDTWRRYLGPWGPARLRIAVMPIPSTVARDATREDVLRWHALFAGTTSRRPVVGHFGTYGDHVADEMRAIIPAILCADADVQLVCLGRGSDRFVERLPAEWQDRVLGIGALSRDALAAALRACDLVVQPYPDGVTTRRTSVMAPLANGVATVTTSGALTEAVWSARQAVALVPTGNPAACAATVASLLHDAGERTALAARGRQLYDDMFAIDRTIDTLLAAPELARA